MMLNRFICKVTAPFKDQPPIVGAITAVATVFAGFFGANFGYADGQDYFEIKNQVNQPSEVQHNLEK
jgi:hypothetical protein